MQFSGNNSSREGIYVVEAPTMDRVATATSSPSSSSISLTNNTADKKPKSATTKDMRSHSPCRLASLTDIPDVPSKLPGTPHYSTVPSNMTTTALSDSAPKIVSRKTSDEVSSCRSSGRSSRDPQLPPPPPPTKHNHTTSIRRVHSTDTADSTPQRVSRQPSHGEESFRILQARRRRVLSRNNSSLGSSWRSKKSTGSTSTSGKDDSHPQQQSSLHKIIIGASRDSFSATRMETFDEDLLNHHHHHQDEMDVNRIIDSLPRDLAAKLDLLDDDNQEEEEEEEETYSKKEKRQSLQLHHLVGSFRRGGYSRSGRFAGSSRNMHTSASVGKQSSGQQHSQTSFMSSLSTAFSSMRSVIVFSTDLDEDHDDDYSVPKLGRKHTVPPAFHDSGDTMVSKKSPRFPWRQSSVASGKSKSSHWSLGSRSTKSEKQKRDRSDSRPKFPWRKGSGRSITSQTMSLFGTAKPTPPVHDMATSNVGGGNDCGIGRIKETDFEHDTSATFRMSGTSDYTIFQDDLLMFSGELLHSERLPPPGTMRDNELPFPVRRESIHTLSKTDAILEERSASSECSGRRPVSFTSSTRAKTSLSPTATILEKKSFLKRQLKFPKQRLGQALRRVTLEKRPSI